MDHRKHSPSINEKTSCCVKLPPINNNSMTLKIPPKSGSNRQRSKTQQPLTTTGLIGWRTANNNVMEKYGRHARGIGKLEVPVSILHRV